MASVLFVSVDNILEDGIFSKNIDPQYLKQGIEWTQDNFLQQICGTDLYNELQTQASTVPNTLTPANETLLNDYLIPCLIQRVKYDALMYIYVKVTNKSVMTKASDVGTPVDVTVYKMMQSKFDGQSIQLGNTAIKYLIQNRSDFPLYTNGNVELYKIRPVRQISRLLSGVFLGNVRRKRGFQDAMGVGYNFTGYYGQYQSYEPWGCW